MKNIVRRTITTGFLALLVLGATMVSQAQQQKIPLDRHVGEIFVAVGNGQYQVWHFDFSTRPPTATLVETIPNAPGSGSTAGCAFDPTYHPFTTNVTANDVFRDQIDDPQTFISTIDVTKHFGAQPTSIAFDGLGNSYVGIAGGNGLIQEYNPSGSFVQTLPNGTSKLKGGSAWIDLSADGKTIYFTNGTNTISQFPVSSSKISKFASISGATLYALRVLTPAAQAATANLTGGPGLLLVAAVFSGSSNVQLFNANGVSIMTYSAPGENNFQVLTLDPIQNKEDNSWSFWAGNPTTNKFYRFNLATGNIEVNGVNTGVGSGPTGLCAYGGFNAAEPQPTTVTASFPDSSRCAANQQNSVLTDCTFSNTPPNGSPFTITLNGINFNAIQSGVLQLALNYSQINPAAGTSDAGLTCDTTAPDNQHCEVFSVDVTPNNGPDGDTSIYEGFDLLISPNQFGVNPFVLKNGLHDVTALVVDPKLSGSDTTQSVFTVNDQPIQVTGSQSCGYTSPLLNSQYNLGRTIPFKFQAVTFPNTCPNGPNFITDPNFKARLVLVQLNNLSCPNGTTCNAAPAPHRVDFTLAGGTPCTEASPCYYRLSTTTWILNVDTSTLQGSVNGVPTQYIGTTIDDSHEIPSFSVTASGQTDIFSVN